jgi:Do/DeqQ family serine protease
MKKAAAIIGASFLSALLAIVLYTQFIEKEPQQAQIQTLPDYSARTVSSASPMFNDFTRAAEMTVNAVVHVKTSFERRSASNPFELFFGNPQGRSQIVQGAGSGVILSQDGYIITNNHVIENAENIQVALNDGRELQATIVGSDPTTDIALIKVEEENLPYLDFSNSDDVKVGEWVLAVGNPFNLTSTVTAGIVSAKGRSIGIIPSRTAIESFIQTDAAVNPGNSGGALVNTTGQLIGINTAISTHTGSFEGYSFAVPSNIAKKVVEDLMSYGNVQRAFIGVDIGDVTPSNAEELELDITSGVYIGGLLKNGAAAEAGIEIGDVIIKIDDFEVSRSSQLQEMIGRKRPGDLVNLTVNRKGRIKDFRVELRNMQGTTDIITKEDMNFMVGLGAQLEPLTSADKRKLGLRYGVKVEKVKGGKFEKAGIPEGFIITKMNNRNVSDPEEIEKLTAQLRPGDGVLIQGYLPNGRPDYFAFGW